MIHQFNFGIWGQWSMLIWFPRICVLVKNKLLNLLLYLNSWATILRSFIVLPSWTTMLLDGFFNYKYVFQNISFLLVASFLCAHGDNWLLTAQYIRSVYPNLSYICNFILSSSANIIIWYLPRLTTRSIIWSGTFAVWCIRFLFNKVSKWLSC